MQKLFLAVLAAAFLSAGCASLTGSKEPSDAEINSLAAGAYKKVLAQSKISQNSRWNAIVQRVAGRIERATGEKFQWQAVLLENPEPNAWCMPGGKIAVYTGIMPILKTEGALAAVLGHEVAHAVLRHGRKQYARAAQEQTIGLIVAGAAVLGGQVLCQTESCKLLTGLGGAAAGFAMVFFDRKFSRKDESQADQYGQIYMAEAGYDPAESLNLWKRMGQAAGGGQPPEWLSTHPSDEHRLDSLREWLPHAEKVYAEAPQKFGTGSPLD